MKVLDAFIDEAGDRGTGARASQHFVLAAVVMRRTDRQAGLELLEGLRLDIGRRPGDTLHWRNIKSHSERVRAAQCLGSASFLTVSSVVVCKTRFPPEEKLRDENYAYLYTFRFLLERLSWLARDAGNLLTYTLGHIVRFKLTALRRYENLLRCLPSCRVAWSALDPKGGRIDQPTRTVELQLADIAASATFRAFEPDRYGNTEPRYLQELAPRLYRRAGGSLTSYGLKIHPWNEETRRKLGWVKNL